MPPTRKSAADADVIWTLLHHIRGERLRDHRDRAPIALGMATALCRSKLVALRVEDLQTVKEGLCISIRRSKTDQDGIEQVVAVPNGKRLRPVALVVKRRAAAAALAAVDYSGHSLRSGFPTAAAQAGASI